MARIQSTAEQFRIAMQGTLEQTRQVLIDTARREHEKVLAADPKPSSHYRIIDGARDAPLEGVKGDGIAIFRYPRLEHVVQFAMETLFDLSPVDSGEYRAGHTIFLNGREVGNLAEYKPGDDIAITNYVPYSRKIEVGTMKMRVPGTDRVYQQARRKIMARWGNVAEVQFTFRGIVGGRQVNAMNKPIALKRRGAKGRYVSSGQGQAHNQRELRFPVLLIKER